MKRDLRVQWQLFAGVALFVAISDVVYWFVSYERAGTTMLALASGLSAFCAAWLFIQDHRDEQVSAEDEQLAEPYLPTTSWWPLVIGLGAALALNGLILSWPYALPGAAVISLGLAGFVKDTRRRT